MDPDLRLDPLNPPKYCPQCAKHGLKTKVKKFRLDPTLEEYTIMCKNGECPWPFSAISDPSEAKVKSSPATAKKRKKNRTSDNDITLDNINVTSPDNKKLRLAPDPPSPPSNTCDREVADILTKDDEKKPSTTSYSAHSSLHTDLTVSPTPTRMVDPIFVNSEPLLSPHSPSYNIPSPGTAFSIVSPKRRLSQDSNKSGTVQQTNIKDDSKLSLSLFDDYDCNEDSLNDFVPGSDQNIEENVKSKDSQVHGQTMKSEEGVNTSKDNKQYDVQDDTDNLTLDDHELINQEHETIDKQNVEDSSELFSFTVMPVVVRKPLHLPKHAAVMLSSHPPSPEAVDEVTSNLGSPDDKLSVSNLSDADDSDSELESLASECSTMSALSESSGRGEVTEEGMGKRKRRGKKKKRKDRRKAHVGKCSKEGPRISDLSLLSKNNHEQETVQAVESGKEQNKIINNIIVENTRVTKDFALSDPSGVPMVSLSGCVLQEVITNPTPPLIVSVTSMSVSSSPIPTIPVSVSSVSQVIAMSITPSVTSMSLSPPTHLPSFSVSPATAMSVTPEVEEVFNSNKEKVSTSPCSESDLEMEDLNKYQLRWTSSGMSNPLSPMSVTESETETTSDLSRKCSGPISLSRGKKVHIPRTRVRSTDGRKGLKVIMPKGNNLSESESDSELADSVKNRQVIDEVHSKNQNDENVSQAENNSEDKLKLKVTNEISTEDKNIQESDNASSQVSLEDDLFKPPLLPPPSLVLRPSSLPSSSHTTLSQSPGHLNLPSPKYTSLPNLLSPMPATPKSQYKDVDELSLKTQVTKSTDERNKVEQDTKTIINQKEEDGDENFTKTNCLEKVVGKLKNSNVSNADKENNKIKEAEKRIEIDPPYPRRRGRKSKAKKFGEENSSCESDDNVISKESENMKTPPETPPKRGRGRPRKNDINSSPKKMLPLIGDIVTSNKSILDEEPIASSSPGSPKINLVSKSNSIPHSAPRTIPTHARVLKPIKSLPPGLRLIPCAPPPGLRNVAKLLSPNKSSQNKKEASLPNNNNPKDKLVTSLFDIEETDIVDKVKLALKHQNSKGNKDDDTIDTIREEKTATNVTAEEIPQPERMKKPSKTFMRTPKKEKALTSLSNKFFLNTGMNIEAVALDHEEPQVETFITLPTLSLTSFPEDDPDFATVCKLGTGTTLDKELSNTNINQVNDTLVGESKDNSILFHVANSAMINQPLDHGNLPVKEQGNTTVLLTQESNQIVVHSMKKSQLRPGRSLRGKGRGRVVPVRDQNTVQQVDDPVSGAGWFQWKTWKVDEKFVIGFQSHISNLVTKWKVPPNPSVDPRIQALLKEKENNKECPETVQQVITFFAEVFVKYLYIRSNFPAMSVDQVLNILKMNYKLENQQFAVQIRNLMMSPPATTSNQDTNQVNLVKSPTKILIRRPVNSAPLTPEAKGQLICQALQGRSPQIQSKVGATTPVGKQSLGPPTAHSTPSHIYTCSPKRPVNLSTVTEERTVSPSNYIPASQWTELEDPNSVSVDNPNSVSVDNPPSVSVTEPTSVKTEPGIENTVVQEPSSCQVYSVYNGEGCSVEMNSVNPTNPNDAIGEGSKVLQFFYQNAEENVKIAFTPVLVNTEEEVNCVVALVTEKNDEFNRRNKVGRNKPPVQYYSSAVQARSILHPDIVKHIDKCFTKRGMKDAKAIGRKRRNYPKRSDRKIVEKDYFTIKQETEDMSNLDDEVEIQENEDEEEYEEEEDDPEEYVPTENEMKMALESKVFGAHMPKSVRCIRPQRSGISDRKGRGGRNEICDVDAPEPLVMGAVEYMLGNRVGDDDDSLIQTTLDLASLFRKKGRRRKKVNIDFENLSDEDDEFKGPFIKKKDRLSGDRVRKSRRLHSTSDSQRISDKSDEDNSSNELNTEDTNCETSQLTRNIKKLLEAGNHSSNKQEDPPVITVKEQENMTKFVEEDHCYPVKDNSENPDEVDKSNTTGNFSVVTDTENQDNYFSKPDGNSDDENLPKERLLRGRDTTNDKVTKLSIINIKSGEVDEMIRSSGRADSRPGSQAESSTGSQAESRPGSQAESTPGSSLPNKVATQLESEGSPERDSQIHAPRQRQLDRELRKREGFESLKSSRVSTPSSANKSPARAALINDNYLKKGEINESQGSDNIGNFSHAFARKRQSEKVKKMLEKQKKKAEKLSNKKYKGFGEETVNEENISEKKVTKEKKKKEKVIKKAQVSRAEVDLMNELLMIGESAVADSKSETPKDVAVSVKDHDNSSKDVIEATIQEFEDLQALEGTNEQSSKLSEELDSLFGL